MVKKRSEHYVNNKELLEALIVYRSKVEEDFVSRYGREPTKEDRSKRWEGNHQSVITWVNVFLRLLHTFLINQTLLITCSETI